MDGIVGTLAQAGVRVIPTSTSPPSFVSKNPTRPPLDKRDLKRWKAFVESVAGTLRPQRRVLEELRRLRRQAASDPRLAGLERAELEAVLVALAEREEVREARQGEREGAAERRPQGRTSSSAGCSPNAKVPIGAYMRDFYRVEEDRVEVLRPDRDPPLRGHDRRPEAPDREGAPRAASGKTQIRVSELGWSSTKGGHPLNEGAQGRQAKMLEEVLPAARQAAPELVEHQRRQLVRPARHEQPARPARSAASPACWSTSGNGEARLAGSSSRAL